MGKFAAYRERLKSRRNRRKCRACGIKAQREDMRLVTLRIEKRYPHAVLFLRNLGGLVLGQKPAEKGLFRYLFGHGFMELNIKKERRWLCFDCFIRTLTPKEYALFRDAYYDDLLIEDGQEQADGSIARMDAVFAAREETTQ